MKAPPLDVREIGAGDWPLWRALRLQALEDAPAAFEATLAEWQGDGDTETRWRERLTSVPFNPVAFLAGRPAGMVSATAPDRDGTAELSSMWVAPFARGRRVGDALVASAIAWAAARRARRLSLCVFGTSRHATALYVRHGFAEAAATGRTDPCAADYREMVLELPSAP